MFMELGSLGDILAVNVQVPYDWHPVKSRRCVSRIGGGRRNPGVSTDLEGRNGHTRFPPSWERARGKPVRELGAASGISPGGNRAAVPGNM